jgi:Peptidase MA superfamily
MLHSQRCALALVITALSLGLVSAAEEEPAPGLNALSELAFSALSQIDPNPLGAQALALHPEQWKHAETEHFVYHYVHSYVATPISVEAEFHFRVIAAELGHETMPGGTAKSHLYIFEKPEEWETFQTVAQIEPWTGGIHSRGSLFIVRDPANKFANNSLGHEIAHLVVFRLYQRPLPRWLEEGFAEYVSRITRASYQRARNYIAHPRSLSIPRERLIPLRDLIALQDYPAPTQIDVFYRESERLVRFLAASDRNAFLALVDSIAHGESFETALSRQYGARFFDLADLENKFVPYASKNAKIISPAN